MHKLLKHPILYLSFLFVFFSIHSCGDVITDDKKDSLAIEEGQVTIQIEGMMCENACGAKIKKELSELPGVENVVVDFKGMDEDNAVIVTYDPENCTKLAMKEKIEKIGGGSLYQVKSLSK